MEIKEEKKIIIACDQIKRNDFVNLSSFCVLAESEGEVQCERNDDF
jgi:hypothetical protein